MVEFRGTGKPDVTVGMIGLTGPSGVLPRHYTDAVVQALRNRSSSLHAFLDTLSHRFVAFFARAGAKYRPARAAESAALRSPAQQDPIAKTLLALTGHGTAHLTDRMLISTEPLRAISGVADVIPVLPPYKLASREAHPQPSIVEVAGVKIGGGHLAMIAGPCAVEEQERMDAIGPMRGVTLTSRVVAPRTSIQEYELAGRKAFVPVIAFNALYEWSGGKAQSSLAYLVGRDTGQEKLGPLRADAGSREIRGLGARPLPVGVRT